MKIQVLSENLQKSLTLINHAISSRNQLPILSHVLLETRDGKVYFSATDLEIGIETNLPATIEEEGAITVPAKLFLELANTLPSGKITLSTEEGSLQIIGTRTKTKLQTTPPDEFPKLYDEKGDLLFSFNGKELQTVLKRIIFSASIEATRPALSGLLVKKEEDGILFVATDGYRLSLEKLLVPSLEGLEQRILIPTKLVRELMALKESAEIHVYISKEQNQILFNQDDTVLVGRLIDAEFPNYEKILPTDTATTIVVDREALHRAVKTCAIFARESANIITLALHKDNIVVSSRTPSLGENTVDVEATLSGEENDIAFNAKYLLDFLSLVDAQEIRFEMTGPLNAGVFRISGNDSYLHLIMPIRTQG